MDPIISLNATLVNAIVYIINQYFKDKILYISNSASEKKSDFHQKDILSEALARIDYRTLLYIEEDGRLKSPDLRNHNMFFVDSHDAFRLFVEQLKNDVFNAAGYFLIVLSRTIDDENIQKILSDCWDHLVVNVAILVESTSDTVPIYSYYPFTHFHCRHVVPVIVNEFKNGAMLFEKLFPKKIANLHRCPIFVIAWDIAPFVYIKKLESGSSTFDGIEGNVLKLLATSLNFTVEVVSPTSHVNPRGFILGNGSAIGSLGMIQRGEVDFTLGSYRYSVIRARVLGTTVPHYHPPMVIAIRRSLAYTSMERLLYPFGTTTWLAILTISVISIMLIKMIRTNVPRPARIFIFGTGSISPVYNMWVSLIGGTINQCPRRNFARFILVVWLLMTLVLRGTYQGVLYQFIRMDMKKVVPNTLQSLANQKYVLLTDPLLMDMVNTTDLKDIVTQRVIPYYDGLLEVLNSDKKLGFLCPRDFVTNFNNVNHGKESLHIVRERLVVLPITIIFRKYSYLLEPVNELLNRFKSNGLIEYWSKKYGNEKTFADSIHNYPRKFTNRNLAGAYQIYGVLIALSAMVFLLEISIWHLRNL